MLSVLLAVLLAGVVVPVSGSAGATDHGSTGPRTTIQLSVQSDGDARFTVTMRFELETSNDTAAFERLGAEFENGTTDVLSVDPFVQAAAEASHVTGRSMGVSAVDRSASRDAGVGRLELSFLWSAFARQEADYLRVGDAFQSRSGTWLPELRAGQELVLSVPDRFRPVELAWPLRNGSVVIQGPVEFDPGEPAATFRRTGSATPTPTVTRTTSTGGTPVTETTTTTASRSPTGASPTATLSDSPTDTPDEPPQEGLGPIVGVLLGLLLAGGLAYLAWSREAGASGVTTDTKPDEPPDPESAGGEEGTPSPTAGNGSSADEPLLSDEERVLNLLEDNDGRMKQRAIVEETDWSNAKVSQLLSGLEEDGEIEKLRIGRENLITLPDDVPDGVE